MMYSYTQEYKKVSYEGLAELANYQKLSEIKCKGFYTDKRGGDTVSSFMTVFQNYLQRENIEYDNENLKILETLQCISEDIIFNSHPTSFEASLIFWPLAPIASAKFSSLTASSME